MSTLKSLENDILRALKQQQRQHEQIVRMAEIAIHPHLSLASNVAKMVAQHEAVASKSLAAIGYEDVLKKVNETRKMIELLSPSTKIAESIEKLAGQILIKDSLFQANDALNALQWSVGGTLQRMKDLGFGPQHDAMAMRLLGPPKAYSDFLQTTIDRLGDAKESALQNALRGSLTLTENQLVQSMDTVCSIIAIPANDEISPELGPQNAPYLQQQELIDAGGIHTYDSHDTLVQASPSAQNCELTRSVLTLVIQCNEASKTAGGAEGKEIFKPTTRLIQVVADLPWLVAIDKDSFANVVDGLYFILYEGAGKDKLRYLKEQGGPLDETHCDVIWCIKHLRNKWSRHDADHGRETEIKKSWGELGKKLKWLGLSSFPTQPAHFRELQKSLLRETIQFLESILSRLALP